MKRFCLCFALALIYAGSARAQQVDVIKLNSGKKLSGTITEQNDSTVTIATIGKWRWTHRLEDIKSIRRRSFLNKVNYLAEIGISCFDGGDFINYEAAFSALYRLRPKLLVGGGIGFQHRYYGNWYGEHTFDLDRFDETVKLKRYEKGVCIPIYAQLRYLLVSPSLFVPFVDLKLGYRAGKSDDFYVSPTVGILFGRVSLGAGIDLCKLTDHYTQKIYGDYDPSTQTYDRSSRDRVVSNPTRLYYWIRAGVRF